MIWLFDSTEQLVSSEVSEIFVSAATSVKFAFYYQISTKVNLLIKKSFVDLDKKSQFVDLKGVSSFCLDQELGVRWICSFPISALVCILKKF